MNKIDEIYEFVIYTKGCKAALKSAIEAKGVEIDDLAKLDTYALRVAEITGGGSGTVFTVQYLDWDGTVLKSQQVLPSGDVLPPANPSRESYNFIGWSGTSYNVQSNLTITAQYEYAPNVVVFTDYQGKIISMQNVETGADAIPPTVDWGNVILDSWSDYTNIQGRRTVTPNFHAKDNKTYLEVELDDSTGLTPTITFDINSGITTWQFIGGSGGGSFNVPGKQERTGTYTTYGRKLITLALGSNASGYLTYPLLAGSYLHSAKSFIEGGHRINGDTLKGCTNLTDIMISGANYYSSFEGCSSLTSVLFPETTTATLYPNIFKDCSSLKTIILKPTSVLTLRNVSAFSGCSADLKIYVPDNLVDSYKAENNWSSISDKIFPINDLAIYGN